MGGSIAFTACVCDLIQNITYINMNYVCLKLIKID